MVTRVPLTQGYDALIDDEDAKDVLQYSWQAKVSKVSRVVYAQRSSPVGAPILMHRHLMRAAQGQRIDHKDGDGLNNRRNNLRPATNSQNLANARSQTGSSKFKGVYRHKAARKWMAYIGTAPQRQYLGLFLLEEDAARAYDVAAIKRFGEFARLNFGVSE